VRAATRTYLWVARSQEAGYHPRWRTLHKSLASGPLIGRAHSEIQRLLDGIALVVNCAPGVRRGTRARHGFDPDNIREIARECKEGGRHHRILVWLVNGLPPGAIRDACTRLAEGFSLGCPSYPSSTTFDVTLANGETVAPKCVIGV